jgi:hypothetical protein
LDHGPDIGDKFPRDSSLLGQFAKTRIMLGGLTINTHPFPAALFIRVIQRAVNVLSLNRELSQGGAPDSDTVAIN